MSGKRTSITSASNAKIKQVIQLQKKRKERERTGLFPAEGIRLFQEIPSDRLDEVFVSESFLDRGDAEELLSRWDEQETFVDVTSENARMVIQGLVYEILLIDNPMNMNEHLEIYLRFIGGQNGN